MTINNNSTKESNIRFSLSGKTAIVTGAGRGIGQGIAQELAKKGAYLIIVEREEERGTETVNLIKSIGGQASEIKADVSKKSDIKELIDRVLQLYGKTDILVNNAGMSILGDFVESQVRHWDLMIGVNLKGLMSLTRAVLKHMVDMKNGKIINIASVVGLKSITRQAVYSATKGSVVSFTRSLAAEVARYHVNVNAICPGFTMTPGIEAYAKANKTNAEYFDRIISEIPWGRPGFPEDIGKLAAYLASEESEYVTGQCIVIDGGASGI